VQQERGSWGSYWIADAIQWQDSQGTLRLGGPLTDLQHSALDDGQVRAGKQLSEAATLQVVEGANMVRINNLTGHKLITGYPEGRRMWLNVKWYDVDGNLVREDGEYGPIGVTVTDNAGVTHGVQSLLDLHDPETTIYEAHYGMTTEWARQLLALGKDPGLVLSYDRITGESTMNLGELGGAADGTVHETFHFVINNTVIKDNRIPPWGMSYDEARRRNALPIPASQYGGPGPGGTYRHWDEVSLNPPVGAVWAELALMYQSTSWEYIQFLDLANSGASAFLAEEGRNLLDAWANTGMSAPYTMVSTVWGSAPVPPTPDMVSDSIVTWSVDRKGNLVAPADTFRPQDTVALVTTVVDGSAAPLEGVQVVMVITDGVGDVITNLQEFSDATGTATPRWNIPRKQQPGIYTATITEMIKSGFQFNGDLGVTAAIFTVE
jgi:hypothetical protein